MKKFVLILLLFSLAGCSQQTKIIVEEKLGVAEYITAPENNTFKIGVKNFQSEYKNDISADNSLQYKLDDKYFALTPVSFGYKNTDITVEQVQKAASSTKWDNVFGDGIGIEILEGQRTWRKIVKIDNQALIDLIPKNVDEVRIKFKLDTNMVIDGWDKVSDFEITDTVRLGDYSYIEPSTAWDSYSTTTCEDVEVCENECDEDCIDDNNGCDVCDCEKIEQCETFDNKIQIRTVLSEDNGELYFTKYLDTAWLKSAQLPVYTDADVTYGTASEFEAGIIFMSKTAKLDTNKFVVCYVDDSDGEAGKCVAGSVSDTTISYGNVSEFEADAYTSSFTPLDVNALDTDKFVVCYIDDTDDDGWCRAASVSGTTIGSYGTADEFNPGDVEWLSTEQISTDKYVICYNDEASSDTAECVCNTVSGTSIVTGTPVNIDSVTQYDAQFFTVAKLDTDKFITCFGATDDADGWCGVGTISTQTITMAGTKYSFSLHTSVFPQYISLTSPDTDKFYLYAYYVDGTADGYSFANTVSGTVITYGTKDDFAIGYYRPSEVTTLDSTHVLLVGAYSSDSGTGYSNYIEIDFSARTVTESTHDQFETGDVAGLADKAIDVSLISTSKVVICYQDDTDSDKGKCIIGDTPSDEEPAAEAVTPVQSEFWF